MTNVTAGAYADMPLFLFHLLEYMDVDYEIDIAEINDALGPEAGVDVWSQIIIKETRDQVELLTEAPQTGIWRLGDDAGVTVPAVGQRLARHRSASRRRSTCASPGPATTGTRARTSARWSPAGRLETDDNQLDERCKQWITGVRGQFAGTPPAAQQAPASPLNFKMA